MKSPYSLVELEPAASGGGALGASPSLPEVHRSVSVARTGSALRRFASFAGPGYLVAVGYMDPGNWATGLAGGSAYGYSLLWVILLSNAMAMLLQTLAARLGIATGRDLAQTCHEHYSRPVSRGLWVLAELAICATDLAEVIGTAVALNLLFEVPLGVGVCLTALDAMLMLWLQQRGVRYLELLTVGLVFLILGCFVINVLLAHPVLGELVQGLVPDARIVSNPQLRYIALGILGATVMPHNLYLHSSIVQTRRYARTETGKRQAIRFATLDVVLALSIALLINASILVLAAASFHHRGHDQITELQDAYRMLAPVLGVGIASVLFGVALLASGKSSTITATLTGQIVMEGFLSLRLQPWLRRLVTRALAIVPALVVILTVGERGVASLLILSQAVLSLQLPFAIVPLIRFTSDRKLMGSFVSPRWIRVLAWSTTALIVGLNITVLLPLL
jgi:manganese transport protein